MNKKISWLFWGSIPFLFLPFLFLSEVVDAVFVIYIKNTILQFEPFSIWFGVSIYFLIIGIIFWKIRKSKNHNHSFYLFYSFSTIILPLLFFASMIDEEVTHDVISAGLLSPDIFITRTNIFYICLTGWMVLQLFFWKRILTLFSFSKKELVDILDEPEF